MGRWRYRPWQSIAVLALATLIAACAGFAPLHYRAMQQSLARLTIERAALVDSTLQLSQSVDPESVGPARVPRPERLVDQVGPELRELLAEPVLGLAGASILLTAPGAVPTGELTWRDRACEHIRLTEGACPREAGEIAVSAADVRNFDLRVGSTVRAADDPDAGGGSRSYRLEVVGVYEQEESAYWVSHALTGRSGTTLIETSPPGVLQHDSWLTARQTFAGADGASATTSTAAFLVDADRVGVDGLLALGEGVEALARRSGVDGAARVTSALPFLADGVRDQIDQAAITVPLLLTQLCLLAVMVLWLVLVALAEQRRPEVALARLRGRGRRGAWWLLVAEMVPVTLAAVVPGAALALLAAWCARSVLLPGNAPYELGWAFPVTLALAAVVLLVVPALATWRVAREPVDRLLRRVPPRASGWAVGAADAVVIAAAGAVVVVFAAGGLDGPIALAAPGLVAVVVGLVAAHLTMPAAAVLGRRLLGRGRVRGGVSALDAARSPATRRLVAIVTLATALVVFSADALVIGQRNRASAAEQEAGAALALTVQTVDVGAVRAAVAEADPGGQRVTPVVQVDPPGSDATATLGVLPDAFPRIALFPGGPPDAGTWDRLRAPDVEPIHVTGTTLSVEVVDSTLDALLAGARNGRGEHDEVVVGVDLVLGSGQTLESTLGVLARGTSRTRLSGRISCATGCDLTAVWLRSTPGSSMSGGLTLRDLTVGSERLPLGPAGHWTAAVDSEGALSASSRSADELSLAIDAEGFSRVSLQHAWLPTVLAAAVAGPLPPGSDGDRFTVTALDGESRAAVAVGRLDRVPAAAPQVYVVDFEQLQRGGVATPTAQVEVWLADDEPELLAATTAALADRELPVTSTRRLADVRRTYDDSVAAWSLQLAALVGGAALLIALLVMVVGAASGWRRWARDLAALRMSGVPGRTTRGIAVAAQLPAVVTGVVAGTASGFVGAQLAMPIVPIFAVSPEVSTLDLDPAWGAVGLAAATSAVVLVGGGVLIGRALTSRATLGRLRETR